MIKGYQHTITWHVDNVISSHVDPEVNKEFYEWCESKYGEDNIGHVVLVTGKIHDYL